MDRGTLPGARAHPTLLIGRLAETAMALALALGLGCAQLRFLKSASVPKKLGTSSTERGPAFSPATSIVASLQPNAQEDWTTYNRTLSGDRYALATAITPANAATLQRVCTAPLGERAVFQTGPIEVGGTIYLTTATTTLALDAESCALRWRHRYLYQRMMAFDVASGGLVWSVPLVASSGDAARSWPASTEVIPRSVADLKGKYALPWTGSAELRHPFGVQDRVSRGALTALDADDGHILWQFQAPTPLVAGVTPTAGGVVFTGDLAGTFYAFDAASGTVLFQDRTGAPIGGGVISYSRQGRQYVAVAVGMHAPVTWQLKSPDARLIVYALPR